jgi:hypothetical protein
VIGRGRLLGAPPEQGPLQLFDRSQVQRTAMAALARAGAGLPVARTRCISLIAADGLTANRRAAWRIELPPSTTATIRAQVHGHRCWHGDFSAVSAKIVESQAPIPRNRSFIHEHRTAEGGRRSRS